MNRLLQLLRHLFGDDPPPRPVGHAPHPHRGHHRHHHDEEGDERRRQGDDQVADAADDGPAPGSHHGH